MMANCNIDFIGLGELDNVDDLGRNGSAGKIIAQEFPLCVDEVE